MYTVMSLYPGEAPHVEEHKTLEEAMEDYRRRLGYSSPDELRVYKNIRIEHTPIMWDQDDPTE